MILMICGSCQMDMMVIDHQYTSTLDNKSFKIIYHLMCENKHKTKIEGEYHIIPTDKPEERMIRYLIEKSNKRYNENTSN